MKSDLLWGLIMSELKRAIAFDIAIADVVTVPNENRAIRFPFLRMEVPDCKDRPG